MGNEQVRKGNINPTSKGTETLGNRNSSSVSFDDFDYLSGKFNYRLCEVKINHDGKYIVGIQTVYEMDGQKKSPGSHQGNANSSSASLYLYEGEYLTKNCSTIWKLD